MSKPKIIIASPSYNPAIGGAIVLHKLCHILNTLGYNSYLTTTIKVNGNLDEYYLNEDYNTKLATDIDIENDIIVYPEIQPGNPFGCKKVIRFILNKFHLPEYDNTISTWSDTDYWLYYHELFYDGIKEKNMLNILDSKVDIFKDYGLERKIEACFTYRKKSHEQNNLPVVHPPKSIEIGYNTQDNELINIFNSCKRFYSYDTETYLSILASLCGCESIVVPYKNITKENVLELQPSFKYGVAYGIEDLEYANSTRHLLKDHLLNLENKQVEETKIAFEKIFKYFNI
jgi:hypothetical protein